MAVITIVLSIGITALVGAQKHSKLEEGIDHTIALIQDARSRALSNVAIEMSMPPPCTIDQYKITFPSINEVQLSGPFNEDAANCDGQAEYVFETYTLPEGIEFTPITITSINYDAPLAEVSFDPSTTTFINITLKTNDNQFAKTFRILKTNGIPELID